MPIDFSEHIHFAHDFADNSVDKKREIPTSDKQTGLELRMTKVLIKDNRTPAVKPFPGLANFYTLSVVIDDINPQPQTLEIAGFTRVGDNEMLPIDRTIYTWLPKKGAEAEEKVPSQIHVFFAIIKSKQSLRKFGKALQTLKQSADYQSLATKIVETAVSGGSSAIVMGISEVMGLMGNILGNIEDKPLVAITQSFTSLAGDFDKVGDFTKDVTTKYVDCSFRLFVRDTSRKS